MGLSVSEQGEVRSFCIDFFRPENEELQAKGRKRGNWQTLIVTPGAPGEYLEEGKVAGMFRRGGAKSLDVRGLEQLGENVCVGSGNGLGD